MKFNQHHVAKRGGQGEGSNKTGRGSSNIELIVPVGTVIADMDTGELLADMTEDGQRAIIARGGIGEKETPDSRPPPTERPATRRRVFREKKKRSALNSNLSPTWELWAFRM